MNTPWGKSQTKKVIAPGITFYSTASHGGYKVNKAQRDKMPAHLINSDGWYEEDCEWCKVALAFPEYFPNTNPLAIAVYDRWFNKNSKNYIHNEMKGIE